MGYTPNNTFVFDAAYTGAFSGISAFNRQITGLSTKYTDQAAVAGAFAIEFDTAWGATVAGDLQLGLIRDGAESILAERFYQNKAPVFYADRVNALIELIIAAENYYTSQGITPPPPPGVPVTNVTGTAPITSTGGVTPAIGITAATDIAAGSMSAADKTKLDGITAGAAVASVGASAPITSSGGTTPTIGITAATDVAAGSMSAADKTKLDGLAIPPAPSMTQTLYVSKGGNDGTGDGSFAKPFLTIQAALTAITDNAIGKRYEIIVGPGEYATAFQIKPWTAIQGTPNTSGFYGVTEITAAADSCGYDASWAAAGFAVAWYSHLVFSNHQTWDEVAGGITQAQLTYFDCDFNGGATYNSPGTGGVDNITWDNCLSYGGVTVKGQNFFFTIGGTQFLGGTILIDAGPVGALSDTKWLAQNTAVGAQFNPTNVSIHWAAPSPVGFGATADLSNCAVIGTVTLTSTHTQYTSTVEGIPRNVVLAGGAVSTQVTLQTPLAAVFNDAIPASRSNVTSGKLTQPAAIDNTKTGIVCWGSDTTGTAVGATGNYSTILGGDANEASGDYSVCGGQASIASGALSAAFGFSYATGGASFACNESQADGADSFSCNEGTATGVGSFAAGEASGVTGSQAFGCGAAVDASGDRSFVCGSNTKGQGFAAFSCGELSEAQARASVALARTAVALRPAQVAIASGEFTAAPTGAGTVQTSTLSMSGLTPGVGANETVELWIGDQASPNVLTLEDGKAYTVTVELVAGTRTGGTKSATLVRKANARQDGGAVTVTAQGTLEIFGDAGTGTYTLSFAAAAAPARLAINFATGGGTTAAVRVSACVRFEEVAY